MCRVRWWVFPGLLAALLTMALASAPLRAGQVITSHVAYDDGHYLVNLDMRINADPGRVFAQLMDFNHLRRINGAITESRLLATHGNHYRVRIVTRGCLWFFCRQVVQVQDIEKLHDRYLLAVVDPKMSDFKFGRILWHVWRDSQGTRVRVTADMVPNFWIPPLIGPWVMKSKLLKQGRRTIAGLERLDEKARRAPASSVGRRRPRPSPQP